MRILTDFHTHTIASGHHTTDTLTAMAEEASKRQLLYLGITDHAPKMPGAASDSYFRNLKYCDKRLYGVNMLYGAELNVLSAKGTVDLPTDILKELDYAIASLHEKIIKPGSESANTAALVAAAENPFINIMGHPDDPTFPINAETLTDAAKATGTIVEFNSVGVSHDGYREHHRDVAFVQKERRFRLARERQSRKGQNSRFRQLSRGFERHRLSRGTYSERQARTFFAYRRRKKKTCRQRQIKSVL